MTKYRITCEVQETHGFQNWLVDADSEKDALEKHKNGESVFESEEIEVLGLGEPEVSKDED